MALTQGGVSGTGVGPQWLHLGAPSPNLTPPLQGGGTSFAGAQGGSHEAPAAPPGPLQTLRDDLGFWGLLGVLLRCEPMSVLTVRGSVMGTLRTGPRAD